MDSPAQDRRPPCPSPAELAAFRNGRLSPLAAVRIADHLARCPHCRTAAEIAGGASAALLPETRSASVLTLPARRAAAAPPARPAEKPLPFTLGQYQVVGRIGRGGMGAVYRAVHARLKREVALKLLPVDRLGDAHAVSRFQREMEAIGRLHHPNVVSATDAGEADGVLFLVMELVDGIDLGRLVRHVGPVGVADACELVRQAALGLHYAHEHGLVHRDVKPSNLMLSRGGAVVLLDLGLALLDAGTPGPSRLTHCGQVMGTADYMAPEQWAASHAVDGRADLYSLGCTLHVLLVGHAPFGGEEYHSATSKMAAHAAAPPPPLTAGAHEVPAALKALCAQLLAKHPEERPATAAEVARALQPWCRGSDLTALAAAALAAPEGAEPESGATPGVETAPTLTAPPARPRGRRRAAYACAAGLALAVALGAAWFWPSRPEVVIPPDDPPAKPPPPSPPKRAGWQELLREPPRKRLWVPKLEARLDHDADKEVLWVHTSPPALIRLGETDARSYKLQLGFRQTTWVGGVGIYFAGQNGETFRLQLIDLRRLDQGPGREFQLTRSTGEIWSMPGFDSDVSKRAFASSPLPTPGNREQLLELEIDLQGLRHVRWNGTPCPALVGKANQDARCTDYRGEFGVYCIGSNVVVTTARFLATP